MFSREQLRHILSNMFALVPPAVLITFASIWFAAAMSPGANIAYTVSVSSRYGFRAGLVGAAGFVTGILFYSLVVAFGLGVISAWFGQVLNILRLLGIAYLLWLAWRLWTASASGPEAGAFEAPNFRRIYLQAALICLTNPKAIIFFSVIFPQATDPARPVLPQLLFLAGVGGLISFVAHAIWSALGHGLGRSVPSASARVVVNRLIAGVFVAGALGLALARLPD